jgi:hypothetical protein
MKFVFFTVVLVISFVGRAQNCKFVNLYGSIKDTTAKQGFYNLFIVNKTASRGVFGKPDGTFSIQVNPGDSVFFRITGYQTLKIKVVADSSCQHEFRTIVSPLEYKKEEVVVFPIKPLSQLKEERERLAVVETRIVTGIDALKSPITALYQEFSRREKMKKKVAALEYQDNMNKVVKELLRVYIAYDVLELSETEFNDFIRFMNLNEDFLKSANDYQLIIYIKEKYIHFRQINSSGTYIYDPNQTEPVQDENPKTIVPK